ncbi:MAG: WbqC family protein [Chloroflexi bacterium]|jgi:hypothetical protein|nr:WbqC family protein [Chloroflexota bacterium]MBT7079956.1 WbqC family protein [Chloroflexota bacterium]
MKIAIHQPNFLPWIGYFYKIAHSDAFVLLDNVQYTKNSFINRNKIKTPHGEAWLTVPVKKSGKFGQAIHEVEINNAVKWKNKHLKTIEMNYKKANFFNYLFSNLEEIYLNTETNNLCQLNIRLIQFISSIFKLQTRLYRSSEIAAQGDNTLLLIDICKKLGADTYMSGFGGIKYQDEELFKEAGIKLEYYDFTHPTYLQLWGEFSPNLSAIDLIFNCGSESSSVMLDQKQI